VIPTPTSDKNELRYTTQEVWLEGNRPTPINDSGPRHKWLSRQDRKASSALHYPIEVFELNREKSS
jgi:hypothetical protein